ncbi:MAG: tetratricopeptide repeat protein [Opitutales bacterium]|nr:tetratricopeptide repeat protein [Opitutales bacterium]
MYFTKTYLWMVASGSIMLISFSCSSDENDLPDRTIVEQPQRFPNLTEAIELRFEKKPGEAIQLLRKHNDEFPSSPEILIQLSRALFENKQYILSAFRFDQAISAGADQQLLLECAQAYEIGGDLNSARDRYMEYLNLFPEDLKTWLSTGRLLAKNGQETEALNAYERSGELPSSSDCIVIGNLYLGKNILVKAEYWFDKSLRKQIKPPVQALIGQLQVKIALGNEKLAVLVLLDIEKHFPGTLDNMIDREKYASILRSRKLAEFTNREIITQNLSATELAQILLSEPKKGFEPVISRGPKLPPNRNQEDDFIEPKSVDNEMNNEITETLSLADAFAPQNVVLIETTPLESGWSAYLSRNYHSALTHARDAINKDHMNAEAWRLSSQAHFQLGQIREAEMTILEAIRHNPKDLKTRIDYLSIARETLSSVRYLRELEKTHERFPDSGEILWQLARRYHIVERMPVTAGILYQRLLKITPKEGGLHQQAKMELIKIQNL